MDYDVFATKEAAEVRIAEMRGWDAEAGQVVDNEGNEIWVIEIKTGGDPQYLRSDGHVR